MAKRLWRDRDKVDFTEWGFGEFHNGLDLEGAIKKIAGELVDFALDEYPVKARFPAVYHPGNGGYGGDDPENKTPDNPLAVFITLPFGCVEDEGPVIEIDPFSDLLRDIETCKEEATDYGVDALYFDGLVLINQALKELVTIMDGVINSCLENTPEEKRT